MKVFVPYSIQSDLCENRCEKMPSDSDSVFDSGQWVWECDECVRIPVRRKKASQAALGASIVGITYSIRVRRFTATCRRMEYSSVVIILSGGRKKQGMKKQSVFFFDFCPLFLCSLLLWADRRYTGERASVWNYMCVSVLQVWATCACKAWKPTKWQQAKENTYITRTYAHIEQKKIYVTRSLKKKTHTHAKRQKVRRRKKEE